VSPPQDRLAMVAAAVAGHDGLEACDLEIRRGGPSYTVDTLEELARLHPGAELHLIVGQDQAANLDTWERADDLRALATLVVVRRPGVEGGGPPAGWRAIEVEVPRLEVSSSDIRRRAAEGAPLDWLVPDEVVRLARDRGLYGLGG